VCPLCNTKLPPQFFHQDKKRTYYQCNRCDLVYVDNASLPKLCEEEREYALHNNHFDDPGYLAFLSRPLQAAINALSCRPEHATALDFGCGPAPVLAALLSRQLAEVSYFDPLFFPRALHSDKQFDLITCTEAIEHFHTPQKEWQHFMQLLSPAGVLVIMTKRVISAERFANWHYKNDPTHVSFFSESTFRFLASEWNLMVSFPSADIAVFKRR